MGLNGYFRGTQSHRAARYSKMGLNGYFRGIQSHHAPRDLPTYASGRRSIKMQNFSLTQKWVCQRERGGERERELYPHLSHLDQAKFLTHSKMGLNGYFRGTQSHHAPLYSKMGLNGYFQGTQSHHAALYSKMGLNGYFRGTQSHHAAHPPVSFRSSINSHIVKKWVFEREREREGRGRESYTPTCHI